MSMPLPLIRVMEEGCNPGGGGVKLVGFGCSVVVCGWYVSCECLPTFTPLILDENSSFPVCY